MCQFFYIVTNWVKEQWSGMLAGAVVTIIFMLGAVFWSKVAERIRLPAPSVSLTVPDPGVLVAVIEGADKGKAIVSQLHTKFDIPGAVRSFEVEHGDCASADVYHSFLTMHSGQVTSDTISLHISGLIPKGWCRVKIFYEPTEVGRDYAPSFLDLHAISRISFVWRFGGNDRHEIAYLDISDLDYIKEDQQALVQSGLFSDLAAVRAMNQERQDW